MGQTKRKILAAVLAMAICFSTMTAFAGEGHELSGSIDYIVSDGVCGDNAFWTLSDGGRLTVSGIGTMYDYGASGDRTAPWREYYITEIIIEEGITHIGASAFEESSSLLEIVIPDGVTSIGNRAFCNCTNLNQVILPDGLAYIGEGAFIACRSLSEINLPNGLLMIDNIAFEECSSLAEVSIPNSVASMGWGVFWNCTDLQDVHYQGNEEEWNLIEKGKWNENLERAIIHYEETDIKVIDISNAVINGLETKIYTGDPIKPSIEVVLDGMTLVKGTDYTVSYAHNINVGIATVTVTGAGIYSGSVENTFKINCKQPVLSDAVYTNGSVQITWEAPVGAKKYLVLRKTKDTDWEKLHTTTNTQYTDSSVVYGTTYRYSVRCVSADGERSTSGFDRKGKTVKCIITGWQKSGDRWYYYNSKGERTTGWQKISDNWYYLGTNGVMRTGWQKVGENWYYLNSIGVMKTGWQKIDDSWYYLGTLGVMRTGWQKISDKWYYFASNGAMKTGWQKIDSSWYYFGAGGSMVTGWKKVDGKWHYFTSGGTMVTGWRKISGKMYYFTPGGAMVTGTRKIGGKTYTFGKNGVWTGK